MNTLRTEKRGGGSRNGLLFPPGYFLRRSRRTEKGRPGRRLRLRRGKKGGERRRGGGGDGSCGSNSKATGSDRAMVVFSERGEGGGRDTAVAVGVLVPEKEKDSEGAEAGTAA